MHWCFKILLVALIAVGVINVPFWLEVHDYTKSFTAHGQKNYPPVIYIKRPLPVLGFCFHKFLLPIVYVDNKFWAAATPNQKEELIFHELGHCLLNRPHSQLVVFTTGNFYIPGSIMWPDGLLEAWYVSNKEYYLDELFHGG